jgi:3-deoxy-D-manno-octulosonic-acid transferase
VAGDVHLLLRERHPDMLTIIVPRHTDRADAVDAAFAARGLKVARRSRREPVTPETDVLLGDTVGEMGLFLRLTEIAFVGRSLTGEGGQNPLEPAMLETAVLSGRNVQNFRDTYQHLIDSGGARLVRDREMLAGAVNFLLSNEPARREMVAAGIAAVDEMRGALDRTLKALDPYIHPLIVKARLENGGAPGR